ncbi:hypothetical protein BaRGS_00009894 [Batillaria attramentaria]|uniref:Uncharacterized protein n=1 Tax=Batillaria attramentaria TaxID=370345 RepID=A0ABD0LHH7_9CAEN
MVFTSAKEHVRQVFRREGVSLLTGESAHNKLHSALETGGSLLACSHVAVSTARHTDCHCHRQAAYNSDHLPGDGPPLLTRGNQLQLSLVSSVWDTGLGQ